MAPEPAELTLEVISPLFIGGADPPSRDLAREGVRPPSLRGALRFCCGRSSPPRIGGGSRRRRPSCSAPPTSRPGS